MSRKGSIDDLVSANHILATANFALMRGHGSVAVGGTLKQVVCTRLPLKACGPAFLGASEPWVGAPLGY